ncbi:MAG: sirohydrochlorin cobaltochelatase [Lachnospiraceae bacterium]|nr:sirohydrochlorin cobaltochelatase [Lachnospiraceae bacterium]
MKKRLAVMLAAALSVCCLAGCGASDAQQETTNGTIQEESMVSEEETSQEETDEQEETGEQTQEQADADTAILVVSFGTSYNDSRDITIGAIEEAIAAAYPQYEVRRAFTSQIIIDILKERDNLYIDNVTEALDRAVADGIKELIVQPTHLMNGYEYTDLARELADYLNRFDKIILAEPLLTSDADFEAVVKAITEKTASYDDGETAICFMGHGTEADSNAVYAKLQDKLDEGGYVNYYIGTVEAEPSLDDVVEALAANGGYTKVVLEPLMVVAGDHANNDMAGEEEDSWKTVLENEGYEVECLIEGLGQIEAIQDIYVEHLKTAVEAGTAFAGVERAETGSAITELTDGTYKIDVESSSSMFNIVKAELTVAGDDMTAVITLSGTGYSKLYLGTGEQAAAADEADCIAFVEDAEGAYTYTLPVAALDQPIDCAAYSSKKEEWYDRQITFLSATLTEAGEDTGASQEAQGEAAPAEVSDGTYTIEVTLEGGSGKATVLSPAAITIEGDSMTARIEWSSSNYDYMLVDGEKYLPVNTEGNSVFEIPVAALDTALEVIGDTVAMSTPHEVEYTLTFHSDTMLAAE